MAESKSGNKVTLEEMPVIYDREMGQQWLERSFANSVMHLEFGLQPARFQKMQAYEVSNFVNSADNDSTECIKPASLPRTQAGQLRLI